MLPLFNLQEIHIIELNRTQAELAFSIGPLVDVCMWDGYSVDGYSVDGYSTVLKGLASIVKPCKNGSVDC